MKNVLIACLMVLFSSANVSGQQSGLVVRMAKLQIDSVQLENYKAALKEHAETAVRLDEARARPISCR